MTDLPAAGAAAGRRLAVRVMVDADDVRPDWETSMSTCAPLGTERKKEKKRGRVKKERRRALHSALFLSCRAPSRVSHDPAPASARARS